MIRLASNILCQLGWHLLWLCGSVVNLLLCTACLKRWQGLSIICLAAWKVITNTKIEENLFNNSFSSCCSNDRHVHPSACPVWLVCRISLRCSADRLARPSACAPSNGSAVFHFVSPLTDMRTPLHALSDWSAVFHFIPPLIDVHTICVFLLLSYAFSHSHETFTLPLLLP